MCVGWHSCCQTHGHRRRGRTRPDRAEPRRRDYNGPGPTPPGYRSHPLVPSTCKQPSLEKNRMNNSQTKPSLLWKPNPHRLQLTITTKLTSSPSARLVHPLAAALSTPSRLLAELTADLSSRCLAPSARTSRLEPTTTARFGGWRRGAGKVAEEGALPEPHPAGCLSAGPGGRIATIPDSARPGGRLVLQASPRPTPRHCHPNSPSLSLGIWHITAH